MPLVFVTTQAEGCQNHACADKAGPFPCQIQDRPAGALAPFHAQGIGAVCYIPRLRAQRDNLTNATKAIPGAPGAVPPRHPKHIPTVVPR